MIYAIRTQAALTPSPFAIFALRQSLVAGVLHITARKDNLGSATRPGAPSAQKPCAIQSSADPF